MNEVLEAECLAWMKEQPANLVDLVFTSPPYEDARWYGELDFRIREQDWVDWMVPRVVEMVRISRGLVAIVVNGKQRAYRWSATPVLLMADLHRAGIHLKKPPIFHRVGIPGSGQSDWLRDDYEFVLCCISGGKLPWSDNTAMGHPPKWATGGEMSYRLSSGTRRNAWSGSPGSPDGTRRPNGSRRKTASTLLSEDSKPGGYSPPKLANPGNVIKCTVGKGHMGSDWAHENEAPFPESLAEFFVRSFCPLGGIVLDPFCGSGTTCAVAKQHGRQFIGLDVRGSQVGISNRRIFEQQWQGEWKPEQECWPCACVRRYEDGSLAQIKMHDKQVARCNVCGCERPEEG